jgi:hypothetical protein
LGIAGMEQMAIPAKLLPPGHALVEGRRALPRRSPEKRVKKEKEQALKPALVLFGLKPFSPGLIWQIA